MANTKFSQFTNQTLGGTGFVVGYDGSTNTRYTLAQLSSALNLGGYVTIGTNQDITGYKTFSTGIAIGSELPSSLATDVMLYLNTSSSGSNTTSIINGQYTTNKSLKFQSNDSNRFSISVEESETGSDLGGNFYIKRFDDSGNLMDSPFFINRQSGLISIGDIYKDNNGTLYVNSLGEVRPYTGVGQTQLSYLLNITSDVQNQLNAKQDTIIGAASTVVTDNLTASRVLVSNSSGKIAASSIPSSYVDPTSSIQTQFGNITSLYSNLTQLSTTATSAASLTTSSISDTIIPVGGLIRVVGLMERSAGASGNTSFGISFGSTSSASAKWIQCTNNQMQFEFLICKTSATEYRFGWGPSTTTSASFNAQQNAASLLTITAGQSISFGLFGFVGTAATTLTIRFVKMNLL